MRAWIQSPFLLVTLLVTGRGFMPAGLAIGQTFQTLHDLNYETDGAYPQAGLILSSNTLYGTAGSGGTSGVGTVFAIKTDGTGFTNLHSFSAGDLNSSGYYTNSSGAFPLTGLILSGRTLYGTTREGGSSGVGTIFSVKTDSTGFTNLHSFTGSDGAYPRTGLLLSAGILYGTAGSGGGSGAGTAFAINTDGTGFTILHSFTGDDGARPAGDLALSDNTLYGTACQGGSSSNGVLFALHLDGSAFTNLHHFTASNPSGRNSDGTTPLGGLILSGNTLYGTAAKGGNSGNGTVFKLSTNGEGLTTVHHFAGSDGTAPIAGLVLIGNTLYGTAGSGGSSDAGTLFRVNIDGTGFENLHTFTAMSGSSSTNNDGANPQAGLMLSDNTLYGTAVSGGSSGHGTLFSLFIVPRLTIFHSEANVSLSWPTNFLGFTLQSATNLVSTAIWTVVSPASVVLNGQNTVITPISGKQQFYRLIR